MSYEDDTAEDKEQYDFQQQEIAEAMARLRAGGVEQAEVVDRPGVLVEKYMSKKTEYETVLNAINVFRDEVNEFARQLEQHYGIKVPYLSGNDSITTTNVDPTMQNVVYHSPQEGISVDEIRTVAAMPPSADPTDFAGNIARSLSAITGALKS